MSSSGREGFIPLHTSAPRSRVEWEIEDEDKVPESTPHQLAVTLLYEIFLAWVSSEGRTGCVERDLALRWDEEHPRVGVSPDVAVYSPATPDREDLMSVKTWREGHHAPLLAIEVVSESHPEKDYAASPEKYAANGAEELWVFDPKLCGPRSMGGPFRLQVWVRSDDGGFERIYQGDGPTTSPRLSRGGAPVWLVPTAEGRRLRVANDPNGDHLWLTGEEREREDKERALAEKDRALAEKGRAIADKDAALAKVAELEALLAKKG